MLKFLSGINYILMHWTKKITSATKEKQEVHPPDNFYRILVQEGQKLKTKATIQDDLNAMLQSLLKKRNKTIKNNTK